MFNLWRDPALNNIKKSANEIIIFDCICHLMVYVISYYDFSRHFYGVLRRKKCLELILNANNNYYYYNNKNPQLLLIPTQSNLVFWLWFILQLCLVSGRERTIWRDHQFQQTLKPSGHDANLIQTTGLVF